MFNKIFIRYCIVLFSVFIILDYGTTAFIGITAPDGKYYSEWLNKNLNYVNWLRSIVLHGACFVTNIFGFQAIVSSPTTIQTNGAIVRMVYSCLGYGVISFWMAFIVANVTNFKIKILWGIMGVLIIVISNMFRVSFLLIAEHKKWPTFFKIDHHTVYNICNYIIIIILIFLFNKRLRKERSK